MSDLRDVIRELLLEELSRMGGAVQRAADIDEQTETVSITSNADLSAFAGRVLALAKDTAVAERIAQGSYPFRLAGSPDPGGAAATIHAADSPALADHHFEKGVVSEKDIANLADTTRQVRCGATVCLTPLAKDALRRRGIKIVRNTP